MPETPNTPKKATSPRGRLSPAPALQQEQTDRKVTLDLTSSAYLLGKTCTQSGYTLPETVGDKYVRLKPVYVSVGLGDIIRRSYKAQMQKEETFPISCGIEGVGQLVSAGKSASICSDSGIATFGMLPIGSPVLFILPNSTVLGTTMDVRTDHVYPVRSLDPIWILAATPYFTARLIMNHLGKPRVPQAKLLIQNGETATGLMSCLLARELGYNVTASVDGLLARAKLNEIKVANFEKSEIESLYKRGVAYDSIVVSVDWMLFHDLYRVLPLTEPFESKVVIHGPADGPTMNRDGHNQAIFLFMKACVGIFYCGFNSTTVDSMYSTIVVDGIRMISDDPGRFKPLLSANEFIGLDSFPAYIKSLVHAVPIGKTIFTMHKVSPPADATSNQAQGTEGPIG